MILRRRLLVRPLEGRLAPAVFTVMNTANTGAGSLRQAVTDANAAPGADSIVFDPGAFASNKTITLSSAIQISDATTISGPTAAKVTVSGNNSVNIFTVSGPGQFDVTFERLAITAGFSIFSNVGAGVSATDERLTLIDCTVSGCKTSFSPGAGVGFFGPTGSLTLINSSVTGNSVGGFGRGGGVYFRGTDFILRNSTVAGNTAVDGCGMFVYGASLVLVEGSTISGNTGSGFSADGGGTYIRGSATPIAITVRNSTIANNTVGGYGAGMFVVLSSGNPGTSVKVQNATVTGNKASVLGGGLGTPNIPLVSYSIESSIVSGNTGGGAPDLLAPSMSVRKSAIGSKAGVAGFNDLGGNVIGAALGLGALANNGGPTQTVALTAGSPAIDTGDNPAFLAFDQRGLPRGYANTDMGAYEFIPAGKPYVIGQFADVKVAAPTINLTVTAVDDAAILVSSLTDGDLRITGPGGFLVSAKFVGVDNGADGTPRVVTYSVTGPSGGWDAADFGAYSVFVEPGQVFDTSGNAVPFSFLGNFNVSIPLNLVVTTTADSGPGSLRQAVLDSNANPAVDSISFSLPASSTITLASVVTITDTVTITGPGADQLAISGGGAVQPFKVDAIGAATVTMSGLTVRDGKSAGTGGGLVAVDETLVLTDMIFRNNTSTTNGGGLMTGGPLTVTRGQFINNRAGGSGSTADGGAVALTSNVLGQFTDSQFTGNAADDDGGAIEGASFLTLVGCTLTGNSAANGGAMASNGVDHTLRNCTVSGNTASDAGGGLFSRGSLRVFLSNCTVVGNVATVRGGGVAAVPFAVGNVTVQSSVVALNISATAPDLYSASAVVTISNSLIGSADGFPAGGTGNLPPGLDPLLGPLQDNGGLTLTHVPLPGSPLRNRGSNPNNLTTDQRGVGFPRVLGGTVDIGAVESIDATGTPVAIATQVPDVTAGGATTYQLKVTFTDDAAIDVLTIGTGDVRVTGPGGYNEVATFVGIDVAGNGSPRVATFTIPAAGGGWDAADNGTYVVSIEAAAVFDTSPLAVPAGSIGSFRVLIARTLVVTNVADSGPGSLRQALLDANQVVPTHDSITFDPGFFNVPRVITLTTGELQGFDAVTIAGPGSALLTVSGNNSFRILRFDPSGPSVPLLMSGLTLTAGFNNADGGAVFAYDDNLTITDVTFTANASSASGGAISLQGSGAGSLTLVNCTFANNKTTGFGDGGAVSIGSSVGTLTATNCTFTTNASNSDGGAINAGAATLTDVTFTGNTAKADGGAIAMNTGKSLSVTRGTFTNNSASDDGGAISYFSSATLTIDQSTLSGNTATDRGGAVYWGGGATTIQDTTFANNKAATGGGAEISTSSSAAILIDRTTWANNQSTSTNGGGGLLIDSFGTATSVTVQNSTFTGNTAAGGVGGAIRTNFSSPALTVRHSTIVGNSAGSTGGGGLGRASSGGTFELINSVVAGNLGTNPDLFTAGTVTALNSAVGSKTGATTYTDLGGNLAFGIDLKLGPLANNGGLTQTIAPLPGSPLLDAAGTPVTPTVDQRGLPRIAGPAADIGSVEVQTLKVSTVIINAGDAQRSRVTQLAVTFSQPVNLAASAFQLTRQSDAAVVNLAALSIGNTVTLSFVGGAVESGSLADGRYTLKVLAAQVPFLDGDGNGTVGDDYVLVGDPAAAPKLYRLFGDSDGDNDVDTSDFGAFRAVFGGTSSIFDFDTDGDVDTSDFGAFRARFGMTI